MVDSEYLFTQIAKKVPGEMKWVLDSDEPEAEGTFFDDDNMGKSKSGGEGIVFFGYSDLDKMSVDGLRKLYVPLIMHQRLRVTTDETGQSDGFEKWKEKKESALVKAKEFKRSQLEKELRDTYSSMGLSGSKIPVVVRVSKLPADVNLRDERTEFILGLRHDNVAYHLSHGATKRWKMPYTIIEQMDGMLDPATASGNSASYYLHVFKSIAKGLRHINKLGIVHRDIKPDNILYRGNHGRPEIKIADFGIMKVDEATLNYRTKTGMPMGTPYYMSPEQAKDAKHLDWKTDQFSLGSTMIKYITGQNPLGQNCDELGLIQIIDLARKRPHKLSSIVTEQDIKNEGIEQVIARTMHPNPDKRYSNWDDLIKDIQRVEKGKLPRHAYGSYVPTTFTPSQHSNHYTNIRRNWRAAGLGAAAVMLIGAGAYFSGATDKMVESMKGMYYQMVGK